MSHEPDGRWLTGSDHVPATKTEKSAVCPICLERLKLVDEIFCCPSCGTDHHVDCRQWYGQCGLPGCQIGKPAAPRDEDLFDRVADYAHVAKVSAYRVWAHLLYCFLVTTGSLLAVATSIVIIISISRLQLNPGVEYILLRQIVLVLTTVIVPLLMLPGLVLGDFVIWRAVGADAASRRLQDRFGPTMIRPNLSSLDSAVTPPVLSQQQVLVVTSLRKIGILELVFALIAVSMAVLVWFGGYRDLVFYFYALIFSIGIPTLWSVLFLKFLLPRLTAHLALANLWSLQSEDLFELMAPSRLPTKPLRMTPDDVWLSRGSARCPVCACAVEAQAVLCPTCHTPHHDECWAYLGGCAIFGCAKSSSIPLDDFVSFRRHHETVNHGVKVLKKRIDAISTFDINLFMVLVSIVVSSFFTHSAAVLGLTVVAMLFLPVTGLRALVRCWRARAARRQLLHAGGSVPGSLDRHVQRLRQRMSVPSIPWAIPMLNQLLCLLFASFLGYVALYFERLWIQHSLFFAGLFLLVWWTRSTSKRDSLLVTMCRNRLAASAKIATEGSG